MSKMSMKKTAAKKSAAPKKTVAKKAAAAAKPKAIKKVSEKLTKSGLLAMLSENTGVNKKDVSNILGCLEGVIDASVKKGSLGEFTLPGLVKIVTIRKPATKARKGISPFTGEETMFKAKPARTVVKVRALKRLKDMVL